MVSINFEGAKQFYARQPDAAAAQAAFDTLVNGTGAGNDFIGWVDLPVNYDKDEFARIQKAAAKIQANSKALVVIGIGGSYLGARAEIAAADADDDQRLGIGLDLRRGLLDAGEFVLVVVHRQVDPADEIVARAGAVHQRVKRGLRRSRVRLSGIKLLCAFKIDAYHIDRSFSKLMQYHLFL